MGQRKEGNRTKEHLYSELYLFLRENSLNSAQHLSYVLYLVSRPNDTPNSIEYVTLMTSSGACGGPRSRGEGRRGASCWVGELDVSWQDLILGAENLGDGVLDCLACGEVGHLNLEGRANVCASWGEPEIVVLSGA